MRGGQRLEYVLFFNPSNDLKIQTADEIFDLRADWCERLCVTVFFSNYKK